MKEVYIRFMAPVIPQTTDQLFRVLDEIVRQKFERVHLLISSPGGSVFHGLSIYNFLKGSPIEVYTYNFGSVDSIAGVIFCAGSQRFSVPHARFLIHGVGMNIAGNASFDEKSLEESLKSLKIDQDNIAKVIADTCGKPVKEIEDDMNERTTLNPGEAKKYGLVHDVKSPLFPENVIMYTIYEPQPGQMIAPPGMIVPTQPQLPTEVPMNSGFGVINTINKEV